MTFVYVVVGLYLAVVLAIVVFQDHFEAMTRGMTVEAWRAEMRRREQRQS